MAQVSPHSSYIAGSITIDEGVTVYSRNGADVIRRFPELSSGVPAAVAGRRVVAA